MARPRLYPRQDLPAATVALRAIRPASNAPDLRHPIVRSRANISNACLTCKQRKRKCLGGQPCPGCVSSEAECLYDEALDRRRKLYNDRTRAESAFQRRLLHGLLTALKGDKSTVVLDMIRADASYEELAMALDSFNVIGSPIYSSMPLPQETELSPTSGPSTTDYQSPPHNALLPAPERDECDSYRRRVIVEEPKNVTRLPTFQELNASLIKAISSGNEAHIDVRL